MELGTLRYDQGKEEGKVEIDWASMPDGVVLLDVLQDWIVELADLYETAKQEVFNKGETK